MPRKYTLCLIAAAAIGAAACLASFPRHARAAEATPETEAEPAYPDAASIARPVIDKGVAYLLSSQKPDGSWQAAENDPPGITALALEALVRSGKVTSKDPRVKKGYEKLLSYQQASGGLDKDRLANYNTALMVNALVAANDPSFHEPIERAVAFLRRMQWTDSTPPTPQGRKVENEKDPWFGGFCYSGKDRPDLSNTSFALDALHDAGISASDPLLKSVQVFMSRCQNDSETNDQKFASDDGGAIYTPGDGQGQSAAGSYTDPQGKRVCRSYGAMTYAFIKGMVYAGVSKDDPRLKAAHDWIGKNWSVSTHPGMELNKSGDPHAGLYYYYHAMARALVAWGDPTVTDAKGVRHDWRVEMVRQLLDVQKPDGSWVGDKRWRENDADLATADALIALEQIQGDLAAHPPADK